MAARYSKAAMVLHWVMAALIILALGLALSFAGMHVSPTKLRLINWHKWVGITVMVLVVARVVVRVTKPIPPAIKGVTPLETLFAGAIHALLYLLMIGLPILGWAGSCAAGYPVVYLGLIKLPSLLAKDQELAELLFGLHTLLGYTLMAAIVLHFLGAMKHEFLDRLPILYRMGIGPVPKDKKR